MKIYKEYRGLENVILQGNGTNTDIFIFDDLETNYAHYFILNDETREISLFSDDENSAFYHKLKTVFIDFKINVLKHFNKEIIIIKKGLFSIISHNENINCNEKLNELIPLYIAYEKEKSYAVVSNDFFKFQTLDETNKIIISKNASGLINFKKALFDLEKMLNKSKLERIKIKLNRLGVERKILKKICLEEAEILLNSFENN